MLLTSISTCVSPPFSAEPLASFPCLRACAGLSLSLSLSTPPRTWYSVWPSPLFFPSGKWLSAKFWFLSWFSSVGSIFGGTDGRPADGIPHLPRPKDNRDVLRIRARESLPSWTKATVN